LPFVPFLGYLVVVRRSYRWCGHGRGHVAQAHTRTCMAINQFYTIGTSILSKNDQTGIFTFNMFQEKHIWKKILESVYDDG
jgi:hypothetical protein